MKKGLLLSVVATGFIFAGGNIAPVAPVQPQVAPVAPAACDFWGQIGVRYETKGSKLFKKPTSYLGTTVVLGVEKEVGYGFGIGAELAGTKYVSKVGKAKTGEDAEISQLYVTYKTGNTAFKLGRQALPKSLSPWAWSDRTVGRLDTSFEGLVVVNTDLADTTLVGAWIAKAGSGTSFNYVNGQNNAGLVMLAAQYKGIANTTLTGSAYYVTKAKMSSVWASAETKAGNFNLGLQGVYAKTKGSKGTFGVAGYAGTTYGALDAKLTLAYLNNGATSLNLGGTSAFWGDSFAAFGGDVSAAGKQKIARVDLGYKIAGYGKVYAGVAMDKPDTGKTQTGARVGYKFNVNKVAAKVEYRYIKNPGFAAGKQHRVRVEGVYKF